MLRSILFIFCLLPTLGLMASSMQPNPYGLKDPQRTYLTVGGGYDHLDAHKWNYGSLPVGHQYLDGSIGSATFGWYWNNQLKGDNLRSDITLSVATGSKNRTLVSQNDLTFITIDGSNSLSGLNSLLGFSIYQSVVDSLFAIYWDITSPRLVVSPYVGLQASQVSTRYRLKALSTGANLGDLVEHLKTVYCGPAIGCDATWLFAKKWNVALGAFFSVVSASTTFHAQQVNTLGTFKAKQKTWKGTVRYQLDLGVARQFDRCNAGLFINIDNWMYSPRIVHPTQLGRTTHTIDKHKTDTTLMLKVTIPFSDPVRTNV